jgi:large subunit ribosomal protein L19e
MNLTNKKELAAKVLGVGKGRIYFVEENLSEIKEAITRADIIDLYSAGAIQVKEVNGRRKHEKRKNRRGIGKVKKRAKNNTKREYVIMTRKLRGHLKHMLKTKSITNEDYKTARKQVRAKKFKSKRHMVELLKKE